MARKLKLVTSLSAIAATSAFALAGCGVEKKGEAAPVAPAPASSAAGSAEGEGGVDTAAAASDAVIFGSALAIAEAHVLAARDAYAAGRKNEAAGMFAHPVSEVLADMEGAFAARGVDPFQELFIDASTAVLDGESVAAVSVRTDAIIAALRAAETKAPVDGRSAAQIAKGVVSDQIDRAVDMYRLAASSGEYGPYLDGYGFYKAAQGAFERGRTGIEAEDGQAASAIKSALALLAGAYPGADEMADPATDIAALSAASSRVMLAMGR